MRYTQLNRIGFYCAQGSRAKPVGRENHERQKICNICGICVCERERKKDEHHRVDGYIWMFGSLCMMCVKCMCVHTHIHPPPAHPPTPETTDAIICWRRILIGVINAPTRLCQSKGCVISWKGPSGTDAVIFIANEKWMDRVRERETETERERKRQRITGELGIQPDKNKERQLVKQTDTYSEIMTESCSLQPTCTAEWMLNGCV